MGARMADKFGRMSQIEREDKTVYTTKFDSPEQLQYLSKKEKKPVLVSYVANGNEKCVFFRKGFLDAAKKYHE